MRDRDRSKMVGEGDSTSHNDLWRDRLAVLADQSAWLAIWDESNRNPGEAWAASANGAGWTSLAGIARYKGVSRL
jgi:hypothetical protein